jgi:hypothetical protein
MPTDKHRISLSLSDEAFKVVSRISLASGEPMSKVITGILEPALPALGRMAAVMEAAKAAPDQVRSGIVAAIDRAESRLIPAAQLALDLAGDGLQAVETVAHAGVVSDGQSPPAPTRRARKGHGGVSTPVPVTRGSGLPKTPSKAS